MAALVNPEPDAPLTWHITCPGHDSTSSTITTHCSYCKTIIDQIPDPTFCICGLPLCSSSCLASLNDTFSPHSSLCVGAVDSIHHPRYQIKVLSNQAWEEHQIWLQGAVDAIFVLFKDKHPHLEYLLQPNDHNSEELEDDDAVALISKAYDLIMQIIPASSRYAITITRLQFAAVIKNVNQQSVHTSSPSKMESEITRLMETEAIDYNVTEGSRTKEIVNFARDDICMYDGDEDEDEGEQFNDRQLLAQILASPSTYFPPTNFSSFHYRKFSHSCCITSANTRSLLDCELDDDYEVRTQDIMGCDLPECFCPRCRLESGGNKHPELNLLELRNLLEFAKLERIVDLAKLCCHAILAVEKKDASVLHTLARVTAWGGEFTLSEDLYKRGLEECPDDEQLKLAVTENEIYKTTNTISTQIITPPVIAAYSAIEGLDNRAFMANDVLDKLECKAMVASVLSHVGENWQSSRHYAVPTTDVPICASGSTMLNWFNTMMAERIFPMLSRQFGVDVDGKMMWRVFDAFFVRYKYEAGKGGGEGAGQGSTEFAHSQR